MNASTTTNTTSLIYDFRSSIREEAKTRKKKSGSRVVPQNSPTFTDVTYSPDFASPKSECIWRILGLYLFCEKSRS